MGFWRKTLHTSPMKGGNTDEFSQANGRLEMALLLQAQHPDVTKVVRKFGRWQHSVDYRQFAKNKLRPKPMVWYDDVPPNNYGMELLVDQPTLALGTATTPI